MPVEIRVFSNFQLRTQKNTNNSLILVLPVIELAPNGNNIPYISRVIYSVKGKPEEIVAEIKKAYKYYLTKKPQPLDCPNRLEPVPCTRTQPLKKLVYCTLEVEVKYFNSDAAGNALMSQPKYIKEKCVLYSDLLLFSYLETQLSRLVKQISALNLLNSPPPQSTQPKIPAMDSDLKAKLSVLEQQILALKDQLNTYSSQPTQSKENIMNPDELNPNHNNEEQKPYPGWLAIDFGTSNSTVTLFDPIEVAMAQLLPKEQQTRLLELLAEWLGSPETSALPGVNPSEWQKFINEISTNLEIDPSRLHEIFQGDSQQRCLEAIRQIELCLGRGEQFRRAVSKKLYQIYHDVFRVPTLESQNLIPVILDFDKRDIEIPSELEITSLNTPLEVTMGSEAKRNKQIAITENTSDSLKEIISKFHHSPKRYFGQEREFLVTVDDGKQEKIKVDQLIQAAWGHLIKLTDKYREHPSSRLSQGVFQMAVVTYPTIAPPLVRKQVEKLVKELDGIKNVQIKNVQTAYDEAVAVVMFFLWREFGGYLNIGIESFKTRCRKEGSNWSQNVLVLDIGGGTTDLALIKLTLKDITPSFKDSKDRGLGGRYYEITPKLLGSSGHLQLGGELITLRMFRLLKVAIVDRLLTAIATGDLQSEELKDLIPSLNERFFDKDGYKQDSLLKCIDKQYPESDSVAYKDALDTAEQVLPTRWKDAPQRLQTFYTLWDYAETAKIKLGKKPPENSPLTFTLSEQQISELLNQTEIKIQGQQNFNNFSVTLNSKQFERAAFSVITEAIGIAKGLMESRLKSDNDKQHNSESEKGKSESEEGKSESEERKSESEERKSESEKRKVDLLILSGKTCNLHIVKSEIYQEFSKSDYFVWNPERITFDRQFTKLATSAGACYAEKTRQLKFSPEEAKELLRKGANQLRIDVKNLSYYLPCNFKRKTQTSSDFLEIFKAGQELYQISPNDTIGKFRNDWSGIQLSNIIYRQDYEDGQLQLWGSFDGNNLWNELKKLKSEMTELEFENTIQIQFEIDSKLNICILLCRKQPHYLINDNNPNSIDVKQVKIATNESTETPAGFSLKKLNHGAIAVNVLESNAVNRLDALHLVFEDNKNTIFEANTNEHNIQFEKFHYASDTNQPPVNGLISKYLPDFRESGKHTFYIYHETEQKWLRIGELSKPSETTEFPCKYRVTLDEKGMLRLHAGEVPYWESDKKECLLEEGCVFRTELDLQPNDVDEKRDPFSGVH